MKRILVPAIVAGSLLSAGQSYAASASGSMDMSMTVVDYCEVKTGGTLTFLPSNAWWNSNVDTNGSFQVQCTNGTAYQVGLDNGAHASGGVRRLNSGSEYLNYQLFQNVGRTTAWGDTLASTTLQSQMGDGDPQTLNVYGRVPSGQTAPTAGTYTDTITITVTY
jgi:spore coat protein U-like protein